MAESEGFEPPIPVKVCRFSRPVPSTTRPTLRSGVAFSITSFQQPRVDGCVLAEYACPRGHKPRREFSHKLSRQYVHHFVALSHHPIQHRQHYFAKKGRDLQSCRNTGSVTRSFAVLPLSPDCLHQQNHADTREAGVDVFEKSFATQATINNSSKKQCQQCHRQRNQVITRYSSRPQACD